MDRTAFMTLGRQQHRFGRLSIVFDVERRSKSLFVTVLAGRELLQGHSAAVDLAYHLRIFMLPNQDLSAAEEVLLRPRSKLHNSKYKKYSSRHTATQTPILDEEFQYPLEEVIPAPQDFSIFIAVVANQPVASDGSGFAGCMSFPLLEILRRYDEMPRWFWLLPKRTGLAHFESVQHHLLPTAQEDTPDVTIVGRSESLPNAFINGDYMWQPETHDGRSVYRMRKRNLILYFHGPRRAWAIGDTVGSLAPYAYVEDKSVYPADIRGQWCVFNKTREFRRDHRPHAGGVYEIDPNVRAMLKSEAARMPPMDFTQPLMAAPLPSPPRPAVAQSRAPAPAAAGTFTSYNAQAQEEHPVAASPRGALPKAQNLRAARPKLHTERRGGFERLAEAHERTTRAAALLCAFAESLNMDIPESTAEVLFEDTEDLHIACKQMMAILEDLIRRDPDLKSNIGAGLRHAANLLEAPLIPIANRLKRAVEAAQRLPPHLDKRLAQVSAQHGSDHTLVSLLRALPALLSYYPSLLQHLLEVTPANYPDHGTLQEATSIFEELKERLASAETGAAGPNDATVLTDNPLAGLPNISIHDLPISAPPEEQERHLGVGGGGGTAANGRVSPYEMMSEAGSRRMSLAPDAEEDEDQLPVADPPARGAASPSIQRPAPQVAVPEAASEPPPKPKRSVSPAPVAAGEPTWMHGDLGKGAAEELLKEGVPLNGRFLIRNRTGQPGEYVLTLTYKQQSTHHLIGRNQDNFVTINRRCYGGNHTTLADALKALVQPVPQWPQPLVDFVPRGDAPAAAVQADRLKLGLAA